MSDLPTQKEALDMSWVLTKDAKAIFPVFDYRQPRLDTALEEPANGANCFVRAMYYGCRLAELGVERYLQQSSTEPKRRQIPHARIVIPTSDETNWGVNIESRLVDSSVTIGLEYASVFNRAASLREPELARLRAGDTVDMSETVKPFLYDCHQFDAGIELYQRRLGISPAISTSQATELIQDYWVRLVESWA